MVLQEQTRSIPKSGQNCCIGILVNPRAARDVRRLVTGASSIPVSERIAICHRIVRGLSVLDVGQILMMPDRDNIAMKLKTAVERERLSTSAKLPGVRILDMPVTDSAQDTLEAVQLMVKAKVGTIVVLGGDGTHRLVAHACGKTPLVCISTGTNNAFPGNPEATIAGLAAGAVGRRLVAPDIVCLSNKRLCVRVNSQDTIPALVDVCITTETQTGTRALWRSNRLRKLFLTFAEPGQVGLSSIGSLLSPTTREGDNGLAIDIDPTAKTFKKLMAPIAPGLFEPVTITNYRPISINQKYMMDSSAGTLAYDGEREVTLSTGDRIEITLDRRGPRTIDVAKTIENIAHSGFLINDDTLQSSR
ncbi:MAG: NAD(+)/NADH kinase [Pseudomonadota bacterium]|nr:NAD(+)/NADH kinase [Pseudomonadota bacterium]